MDHFKQTHELNLELQPPSIPCIILLNTPIEYTAACDTVIKAMTTCPKEETEEVVEHNNGTCDSIGSTNRLYN
jgi:hypothetical protein